LRDTPSSGKLSDRDVFLVEILGLFRAALRHKYFSQLLARLGFGGQPVSKQSARLFGFVTTFEEAVGLWMALRAY